MNIVFDTNDQRLLDRLSSVPFVRREVFDRRTRLEEASLSDGFRRMLSIDEINRDRDEPFRLYPHQEQAVRRVLTDMNGRAILADEVGLGKTIEAGVVLHEYMLRRFVHRALILVPASLVSQWRHELYDLFRFDPVVGRVPDDFSDNPFVIASIDRAKREDTRRAIKGQSWDMVIVDEAHRLKNRTTLNWRFVNEIQKTYLLLLTATPIQNDLRELYNLVTLLKPGQLKTFGQFKRFYMLDKHQPKNTDALKEALHEVMIRTSRQEAGLLQSKRIVRSYRLTPSPEESAFYAAVLTQVRRAYKKQRPDERNILPLIQLLRQAASHPMTALESNTTVPIGPLRAEAKKFTPVKVRRLRRIVKDLFQRKPETSVIVFTQFLRTQSRLCTLLQRLSVKAWAFHGRLTDDEKQKAIDNFRRHGGVLVCTDAGSEGRNLQFCRTVINYDLPWNPMKLEQRIGRVHRIGQKADVNIVNLVTAGTIEDDILFLLEKKINMFEKVIGEIDAIISGVKGGFGGRVVKAALTSESRGQFTDKMHALGEDLAEAESAYDDMYARSAGWLGGRPSTR